MDIYQITMRDTDAAPLRLVVGKIGATFEKGRGIQTCDPAHVAYAKSRPNQFDVINLSASPPKPVEPEPPRDIVVPITPLDAVPKPIGDPIPPNQKNNDFALADSTEDPDDSEPEEAPEPVTVGFDDAIPGSDLDEFPEFVAWEELNSGKKSPTVDQLVAFADEWGIELGDAKLKADIVAAIEASIDQSIGAEEE